MSVYLFKDDKKITGYKISKFKIEPLLQNNVFNKMIITSSSRDWCGILFCHNSKEADLLQVYNNSVTDLKPNYEHLIEMYLPDIKIKETLTFHLHDLMLSIDDIYKSTNINFTTFIDDKRICLTIDNNLPFSIPDVVDSKFTVSNDLKLSSLVFNKHAIGTALHKWIDKQQISLTQKIFNIETVEKFKLLYKYSRHNFKLSLPLKYAGQNLTAIKSILNSLDINKLRHYWELINKEDQEGQLHTQCKSSYDYIIETIKRASVPFSTRIGGVQMYAYHSNKKSKITCNFLNKDLFVNYDTITPLMAYFDAIGKGEQLFSDINKFKLLNC